MSLFHFLPPPTLLKETNSSKRSRTRHGQKCPSRSRGLDGTLHNFCRIASFPARARFRTRLVTKPKMLLSFPSSSDSEKSYWPKTTIIISCRSRKPAASWAVFQPLRMAKWPTSYFPFSVLRCFTREPMPSLSAHEGASSQFAMREKIAAPLVKAIGTFFAVTGPSTLYQQHSIAHQWLNPRPTP